MNVGDEISIGTIFDPLRPSLTPEMGANWGVKLDIRIVAKQQQIEQNFVLTGNGKSWANPNPLYCIKQLVTHHLSVSGDLKTPLNYIQTIADGATLRTDRRCEVIVVANASKYSVDSH